MRLIPFRKGNELALLDKLFDLDLEPFISADFGLGNIFSPRVDILEDKDNFILKADLPGLNKDEIDVSLDGDLLRIKGQKQNESEVKQKNFHRVERFYGSFQRAFYLPKNVDAQATKAEFKNGVLVITLPKTEEAKQKRTKIEVN